MRGGGVNCDLEKYGVSITNLLGLAGPAALVGGTARKLGPQHGQVNLRFYPFGGLELASSFHIRVADETTYFALPEGQRGIFTGGGATVRVARMVGEARKVDMMLTGRVYSGQEAVSVGLCQYLESRRIASKLTLG